MTIKMTEDQILSMEREVRESTGLNWQFIEINTDGGYFSWQLIVPMDGERIKVSAISYPDTPNSLVSFGFDCQPRLFLELLKKAAA